jgi:hypothetical protein
MAGIAGANLPVGKSCPDVLNRIHSWQTIAHTGFRERYP